MKKIQLVLPILCTIFLMGCMATAPYRPEFTVKTFSPTLGDPRKVSTGDNLFVEGAYIPGETITVDKAYDLFIPGSMFIPFPVRIEASDLRLKRFTLEWKYYCADESMATASFPGLGTVVRRGDCIGIRISSDGKDKEWVVDNSIYNGGRETIWSSQIDAPLRDTFVPKESPTPFRVRTLRSISFDGYYGGQLHFTWTEVTPSGRNTQNFTFDYVANRTSVVGMRGYVLEVINASSLGAVYRWVQYPGLKPAGNSDVETLPPANDQQKI